MNLIIFQFYFINDKRIYNIRTFTKIWHRRKLNEKRLPKWKFGLHQTLCFMFIRDYRTLKFEKVLSPQNNALFKRMLWHTEDLFQKILYEMLCRKTLTLNQSSNNKIKIKSHIKGQILQLYLYSSVSEIISLYIIID